APRLAEEPSTERSEFGRLFQNGRSANWLVRIRLDGKERTLSCGTAHRRQAEKFVAKLAAQYEDGTYVTPAMKRVKFDDLADLLLHAYRVKGNRSTSRAAQALARLRQTFGGVRALRITGARIVAYEAARLDAGAARATLN